MSKLDDIFRTIEKGGQRAVGGMNFIVGSNDISKLKQEIKTLLIEMIGDDEHMQHFSFHGRSDIRDELRRELRQKVSEL